MTSEYRKVDVVINADGLPKDKDYHIAWRCKNCQTVIMSLRRHDWVACHCYSNTEENTGIFIDGGRDYLRGGGRLENIESLTVKLR